MDGEVEEECHVLYVPKDRCRYMSVELEHIRVIVTIGMQINLDLNLEDGIMKLTTLPETQDRSDLLRCANFIKAIIMGFSIPVARKLLHRDDLRIDSLNINITGMVVGNTKSQHMYNNLRRTKYAIEQVTRTSLLMNKDRNTIYILGCSSCIKKAKDYLYHLISLYQIK
ncbi:hypothetical protein BVC80_9079g34 [Macleaya cordata]|uniref:Uncharacterized protein n=1 Tax=Macleaya cordata TaxID=56857 RepID=A0A200PUM2_MACCD|nr:hypothetical protein BVC80_9079g34 [Macleaya cordata]